MGRARGTARPRVRGPGGREPRARHRVRRVEIQARGPSVFSGYRAPPGANDGAFTQDGWFRTGDLGRFDDAGNLLVTGRVKEMIVLGGGKNVFPEELEATLARPEFKEIAVTERNGALVALVLPDMARIAGGANTRIADVVPHLSAAMALGLSTRADFITSLHTPPCTVPARLPLVGYGIRRSRRPGRRTTPTNQGQEMTPFKTLLAATGLALAAGAFAQNAPSPAATPGIDQRQANQEKRIDQGVASGALTKRETNKLERQQGAIDKAENQAKADGTVTHAERKRVHRMQNHASRSIKRQKHDAQVAPKAAS